MLSAIIFWFKQNLPGWQVILHILIWTIEHLKIYLKKHEEKKLKEPQFPEP